MQMGVVFFPNRGLLRIRCFPVGFVHNSEQGGVLFFVRTLHIKVDFSEEGNRSKFSLLLTADKHTPVY